jgi:hypothetical protein
MTPEQQLAGFIAKFTPEIAGRAHDVLARMRSVLPGAVQLVYDNYNALAIGFGPNERTSDSIFSIAVFPRWVSLFFLQGGPMLPDPHHLLKGTGKTARHIVLTEADMLDDPLIQALMMHALEQAHVVIDPAQNGYIVIKSISKKQRPRHPA